VLRPDVAGEQLLAHTGAAVTRVSAAFLDEEGAILLRTDLGPGALADADLDWALERLDTAAGPPDEEQLAAALALPSGSHTALYLRLDTARLSLQRLDRLLAPQRLGFVRDPQPLPQERHG